MRGTHRVRAMYGAETHGGRLGHGAQARSVGRTGGGAGAAERHAVLTEGFLSLHVGTTLTTFGDGFCCDIWLDLVL